MFVFCVYFVSIVRRAMQGDAEMASGAKSEATRSDAHSSMRTMHNLHILQCTQFAQVAQSSIQTAHSLRVF